VIVLGLDVGALGKELVDEVELAVICRPVEDGHVKLRWGSEAGSAADRVG
jgi:hypothetical protein